MSTHHHRYDSDGGKGRPGGCWNTRRPERPETQELTLDRVDQHHASVVVGTKLDL